MAEDKYARIHRVTTKELLWALKKPHVIHVYPPIKLYEFFRKECSLNGYKPEEVIINMMGEYCGIKMLTKAEIHDGHTQSFMQSSTSDSERY